MAIVGQLETGGLWPLGFGISISFVPCIVINMLTLTQLVLLYIYGCLTRDSQPRSRCRVLRPLQLPDA